MKLLLFFLISSASAIFFSALAVSKWREMQEWKRKNEQFWTMMWKREPESFSPYVVDDLRKRYPKIFEE